MYVTWVVPLQLEAGGGFWLICINMFGMCNSLYRVRGDVLDIYDWCSFLELLFQHLYMARGQVYLQCDDDILICESLLGSPAIRCTV